MEDTAGIPNKINNQEWNDRLDNLLKDNTIVIINSNKKEVLKWMPKDKSANQELFNLWNDKFKPFETNWHCGSCQLRVFDKIQIRRQTIK